MFRKKLIESSYLARYFLLNAAGIDDHRLFLCRDIANAGPAFHFSEPDDKGAFVPMLDPALAGTLIGRAVIGRQACDAESEGVLVYFLTNVSAASSDGLYP